MSLNFNHFLITLSQFYNFLLYNSNRNHQRADYIREFNDYVIRIKNAWQGLVMALSDLVNNDRLLIPVMVDQIPPNVIINDDSDIEPINVVHQPNPTDPNFDFLA